MVREAAIRCAEAVSFATARVAAGARELRNLIVLAWDDSLYRSVGYPEIPVQAILGGKVLPPPTAFEATSRNCRAASYS